MHKLLKHVLISLMVLSAFVACVSTDEMAQENVPNANAEATAISAVPSPWTVDFEDGTTMGWAGNNATADVAQNITHGGSYSMKVVSGDAGWKTVWFYNCGDKILADVPYSYSAWIYQESGQDVKFNITIKTTMSAYKGAVYGATVPSGKWTEIKSDSFVLSSDSGSPQDIYIEPQTPGTVFYVDDIAILPK